MKKLSGILFCMLSLVLVCLNKAEAQENLQIGEWTSLLPYKSGKWVTQSDDHIIYATDFSLLFIRKDDNSASFMSKVDGLSDAGINLIQYDNYNDQLVVVYTNSNIDFITTSGITNESAIKDNSTIIGSRNVNDIAIAGRERIFFATDFGILEYRSAKQEFGSTIITPGPILAVERFGDNLYAVSEEGLYMINETLNPNIGDFGQWTMLSTEHGLPVLYEGVDVTSFDGDIIFTDGLSIWRSAGNGDTFSMLYEVDNSDFSINFLSAENSLLLAGLRAKSASRCIYFDDNWVASDVPNGCVDRIRYGIEDEKGQLWFADNFRDFRYLESPQGLCRRLDYNSPLTEKVSDIKAGDNVLVIASGGVTDAYFDLFNRDGVFILRDGKWENINESNFAPIKENDLLNFFRVLLSKDESSVYLGTFWKGIMKYELATSDYIIYNETNSSLQPSAGDGRVRISDMIHDSNYNLWITNYNAPRPLVMKDLDDNWYSFTVAGDNRVGDMTIDENGNKWMVTLGTTNGVFVFNEGGDVTNTSDDKRRWLSLNNSAISTTVVFTVTTDLEGNIWVGTAEGVVVFEGGQDIFNPSYQGLRKTVEVDGIAAYLLESEEVRTIGIDGANRKWFGTRNGIFVQSPDGVSQIARYTIDNSPLFDNEIIDLEFDGSNGIMYIATNKGVQAVKTETTSGKSVHDNKVFAFPNPVTPDYRGPIAIKGLAADAVVKITDLNGRLIYETQALGGQAIWDGNDLTGTRVGTGVYLVFSTGSATFGEPDSYVTKILFIN